MKANKRKQRRHASRCGFSLVECMATLSILMVLGLSAATLLAKVTQIGVQTNQDKMSRQMVVRLSRQLRRDIAESSSVDLSDDGSKLQVKLSDQTVTYETRRKPAAVDRSVSTDENVTAVEQFGLPVRCEPLFSQTDQTVDLRLTASEQLSPWIIQAVKP
ncbi:MAG: prepilin-type N-terminal cleavage/methylation domain-containing protein [Pirellulaceae bacterium]